MSKLKLIASKLQRALAMNGKYITINQIQVYSGEQQRLCTKYVLKERQQKEQKTKYVVIYDSFRMIDIVNYLARILNGGA